MKKYNLIYADPPWQYSNQSTRAATKNHHPTLKTQSIKKLPIPKVAEVWEMNAKMILNYRRFSNERINYIN